ncbi:PREDICTED: probable RNA polymerase II nuclear localization protein SLC7A6OS isoform X2 [Amphimedon queenslandica]|uniref:Probable RNA polymerase II nuclear localization protein SLC7A6OS n=1 Tax=Amphimedon queenslandica TaxID=400682 RepID=A0A1X7TYW6_AMPQE|nr:PREDICTED: probable RNA polymerase II nuclear localization protein SLC7A6OS isoform X2 [Amphimedon queenslandica]|eukprot:XP_011406496.1 PREDICTED: probable RNA polymerase II nuclear localization protein SLC7A6OS isoform X2 [Amphimedon queenslandica]
MATAQQDSLEYVSVVLRVKRKRTSAEDGPPDALVVASKSMKLEQTEEASNSLENSGVFHWCGTYNGDIEKESTKSDKPLLDIVSKFNKKRPINSKISPFHKLTISDSKEQAKVEKKKSSAANRFKLLSSRRCLSDSRNEEKVSEGDRPLHLYEVVMDQDTQSKVKEENGSKMEGISTPEAAASVEDIGDITCNSTVLTREKITTDDNDDDGDYVYDVYMSRHCNMEAVSSFDWSTLSVYSHSSILIHDIFESDDDKFEDEDDSNDESNWRNDYPDEEDSESSSACSNSSVDSDNIHHSQYRHREPYYDELEFFGDSSGYYDNDNYEGGGADDYDTDDEEYV